MVCEMAICYWNPKLDQVPMNVPSNLALASVPATVIWDLTYITYFTYIYRVDWAGATVPRQLVDLLWNCFFSNWLSDLKSCKCGLGDVARQLCTNLHTGQGSDEMAPARRRERDRENLIIIICKHTSHLGPVYTTVEKASGRSRMLGQDMVI